MGRKGFFPLLMLMGVTIALLCPGLVLSDCVDLKRATGSYVQGGHSIIFYEGLRPISRVDVPYCALSPTSSIRLITSYICDGDNIIIDGSACTVISVYSASTSSF
jgi:hypothetical protein